MIAVNYSNLRGSLKDYCDKINDEFETIIVTRKNNKNIVMISQEEYNNLIENMYIMSNKAYYDRLIKSKNQIEKGHIITKTTKELEEMANE
jgi:antitoxin YefM